MTSAWPTTIPQCPVLNGFSEEPQVNTVAFAPDIGPPKIRRRSSSKMFVTSLVYRMTNAEVLDFQSFYDDDLASGSLPFSWEHPVTKNSHIWIFDPKQTPKFDRATPNTFRVTFTLLRYGDLPTIPPQAFDVGYITQTLHSEFTASEVDIANTQTSGFKWYPWNYFSSLVDLTTIHLQDDGSVLMDGDVTGPGGGLTSLSDLGGGNFVGTAYGGGGYFECTFKFDPQDVVDSSFNGWPSWWSMAYEHLLQIPGGEDWAGQAAGYHHFIELDFFEYLASAFVPSEGTNFYGSAWRDYSGFPSETISDVQYPRNIVRLMPLDPDFTQYHKYGCLWVPASGGDLGYLKFYFDNWQVGPTYTWLESLATDPPWTGSQYNYSHTIDDFGLQGQNVRVVIDSSLLGASTGDNIMVTFAQAVGENATIDSAYIGHAAGAVTGTGGVPGSDLMPLTSAGASAYAGTPGAGNVPTGYSVGGIYNGNTLVDPGAPINAISTYYDAIRTINGPGGGYQGIQLTSLGTLSFIAGRRYLLSAWIRQPTGVPPGTCGIYFSGNFATIATSGQLGAATPDVWTYYETDYTADGSEVGAMWVNSSGNTGEGFDLALPQIQLYSIDPYVVTFDGTKTQLTFNGGSPSASWDGSNQPTIISDPVPFAYDNTKDIIIAYHVSGDEVQMGCEDGLPASSATYLSVTIHTSADNPQTDNSANTADSFNAVVTGRNTGISHFEVATYTRPGHIDRQHLGLVFGTSPYSPMTVKEVNVWQVDATGNVTA